MRHRLEAGIAAVALAVSFHACRSNDQTPSIPTRSTMVAPSSTFGPQISQAPEVRPALTICEEALVTGMPTKRHFSISLEPVPLEVGFEMLDILPDGSWRMQTAHHNLADLPYGPGILPIPTDKGIIIGVNAQFSRLNPSGLFIPGRNCDYIVGGRESVGGVPLPILPGLLIRAFPN